MTDKPEVRITKTLAAMARGAPLARIERICESQKTVSCSVLARMVEEAQDINTDYALTFKHGHEASRAADKARIADLTEQRDSFQRVGIEAITARSDAIELLRAIHNGIHCDTLPGNLYQRLELMLFPAQQGKEGGV